MPEKTPAQSKRMPFPVRGAMGAILAAAITAGSVFLFDLGKIDAPTADDFHFTRGVSFADGEEARLKGYLASIAAEDRVHLRITGHTGTKGDDPANQKLSTQRAQAVEGILSDLGFSASRIDWVGGIAGANPLPRDADQSEREWERGLSRVTVEAFVSK